MARQGRKTPAKIERFVIVTKRNAPGLNHRQIADLVKEQFGEGAGIDKSTVGRILQRARVAEQPGDGSQADTVSLEGHQQDLLTEVERLGRAAQHPRTRLTPAPTDSLTLKVHQDLREHTQGLGLPGFLEAHESALEEYRQVLDRECQVLASRQGATFAADSGIRRWEDWTDHLRNSLDYLAFTKGMDWATLAQLLRESVSEPVGSDQQQVGQPQPGNVHRSVRGKEELGAAFQVDQLAALLGHQREAVEQGMDSLGRLKERAARVTETSEAVVEVLDELRRKPTLPGSCRRCSPA